MPFNYNYIDVYAQTADMNFLRFFELTFKDISSEETVFFYAYHPEKTCEQILIGTFAKVTDGWKFYPIFQECNQRIEKVIKEKYKPLKRS